MSLMESLAPTLVASGADFGAALLNYGQQQENMQYLQSVQRTEWNREDNAVQRRARDLEAAGFNPVLATGQAAQAGTVVKTEAPQFQGNIGRDALENYRSSTNIAQTEAQTQLTAANARKANVEADVMEQNKLYLSAQMKDETILTSQLKAIRSNQISEAEFNNVLAQVKKEHVAEFAQAQLDAAKAGVTGQQLQNQERALAIQLLEKDLKWYDSRAVFDNIGRAVGAASRIVGWVPR